MRQMGQTKTEKACILFAVIAAALITALLLIQRGSLVEARAGEAQRRLAGEVLRFHVLADSDSDRDQELKMEVKEGVIAYMQESLAKEADLEETVAWAEANLPALQDLAEGILQNRGCSDAVQAEVVKDYFPEKTYGDITFPAGEYRALRLRIGKAQGQNWWCCLYPRLCFTDAVRAVVPEEQKEEMGCVLGEDEYEMVTAFSEFRIKWFFFGD